MDDLSTLLGEEKAAEVLGFLQTSRMDRKSDSVHTFLLPAMEDKDVRREVSLPVQKALSVCPDICFQWLHPPNSQAESEARQSQFGRIEKTAEESFHSPVYAKEGGYRVFDTEAAHGASSLHSSSFPRIRWNQRQTCNHIPIRNRFRLFPRGHDRIIEIAFLHLHRRIPLGERTPGRRSIVGQPFPHRPPRHHMSSLPSGSIRQSARNDRIRQLFRRSAFRKRHHPFPREHPPGSLPASRRLAEIPPIPADANRGVFGMLTGGLRRRTLAVSRLSRGLQPATCEVDCGSFTRWREFCRQCCV